MFKVIPDGILVFFANSSILKDCYRIWVKEGDNFKRKIFCAKETNNQNATEDY